MNVDAELVKRSGSQLSKVEEKMVEMSNGFEIVCLLFPFLGAGPSRCGFSFLVVSACGRLHLLHSA